MSVVPYTHPDSDGQCGFCWLYFRTMGEAIDHEATCQKNPDRVRCPGCGSKDCRNKRLECDA